MLLLIFECCNIFSTSWAVTTHIDDGVQIWEEKEQRWLARYKNHCSRGDICYRYIFLKNHWWESERTHVILHHLRKKWSVSEKNLVGLSCRRKLRCRRCSEECCSMRTGNISFFFSNEATLEDFYKRRCSTGLPQVSQFFHGWNLYYILGKFGPHDIRSSQSSHSHYSWRGSGCYPTRIPVTRCPLATADPPWCSRKPRSLWVLGILENCRIKSTLWHTQIKFS